MGSKAKPARPADKGTTNGALLSGSGTYRYWLRRQLGDDPGAPAMVFVMLNPSTADATTDDPTIRRCCGFARREGYGALEVVNLFAFRATDWHRLLEESDPVGPKCDRNILAACGRAGTVVAAWGTVAHAPRLTPRAVQVTAMLEARGIMLHCLGTTGAGWPRHPLYLAANAPLRPWSIL